MNTLEDVLPRELATEFQDTRAFRLRTTKVVATHDARILPWPGKHKNVNYWWEVEGDLAVAWNENPATGWSFPVISYPRIKVVAPCPHLTKALGTLLGVTTVPAKAVWTKVSDRKPTEYAGTPENQWCGRRLLLAFENDRFHDPMQTYVGRYSAGLVDQFQVEGSTGSDEPVWWMLMPEPPSVLKGKV